MGGALEALGGCVTIMIPHATVFRIHPILILSVSKEQ